MRPEATNMEQPCGATDAAVLPRQTRTRQGRARLLTLDHLDQRTAAARAARTLVDHLTSDLGGDDQLSAGERELVKRAALCGAIVADFEARWVAGQLVELGVPGGGQRAASRIGDAGVAPASARRDAARSAAVRARGGGMNILQALDDPNVFGPFFRGPTWGAWRAFLAALFGLPLTIEQLAIYQKHTGRSTPPAQPSNEAGSSSVGAEARVSFLPAVPSSKRRSGTGGRCSGRVRSAPS